MVVDGLGSGNGVSLVSHADHVPCTIYVASKLVLDLVHSVVNLGAPGKRSRNLVQQTNIERMNAGERAEKTEPAVLDLNGLVSLSACRMSTTQTGSMAA